MTRFALLQKMRIGLAEIQNVVAGELAEQPIFRDIKCAYNFRAGGANDQLATDLWGANSDATRPFST
jgi:hypothetical protein